MTDELSDEMSDTETGLDIAGPPQEMYKMLRDHMPVLRVEHELMTGTSVSLHEDVMHVLRNPDVFSSLGAAEIGQVRPLIPLEIDPPEHLKYRKLLDPALRAPPGGGARRHPPASSRQHASSTRSSTTGECNFHQAVGEPLPSQVFLTMFGLPVERTAEFIELKDGIIRPPGAERRRPDRLPRTDRVSGSTRCSRRRSTRRRRNPQGDFISQFLDAEVDGHRLTEEDVLDIGYLFFLAGLDTVTASLDCMLTHLAQNPSDRQRLADDPAQIPAAVEELLRWETPVTGVIRVATRDTELSGCPIHAGDKVSASLGSANTDERFWSDGDAVDFDRESNKHIAFGAGVHRCLGSHLARMELRVALEEWHRRIPSYELKPGTTPQHSMGLRSVDNLELVW